MFTVGNKNDIKHRKVSYKEADHYAGLNGMKYIETSSKEDNNVDQVSVLCGLKFAQVGYSVILLYGQSSQFTLGTMDVDWVISGIHTGLNTDN